MLLTLDASLFSWVAMIILLYTQMHPVTDGENGFIYIALENYDIGFTKKTQGNSNKTSGQSAPNTPTHSLTQTDTHTHTHTDPLVKVN